MNTTVAFKDIKIGQRFFEANLDVYYVKVSEDHAVFWDESVVHYNKPLKFWRDELMMISGN